MHVRYAILAMVMVGLSGVSFGQTTADQEPAQAPDHKDAVVLPAMRFTLDSPSQDAPSKSNGSVSLVELGGQKESETKVETTTVERRTVSGLKNWDIVGPIQMRSADPEPPGEFELKNIFDYGTSSDGSDDDVEYELEIEWGIAPNHELIFEIPVEMGDGGVDGNADLTLGWHWRLWKEQEILPAFAMRNFIRVPSGYHSSGVDYELRGLITKSIIPNKFRFHLNPFLKSVNGNNEEDHRFFQWGIIAGIDYRITEELILNADYVHETSEIEGHRNQHTLEVGLDWKFAPRQTLGFVTRAGLDGDDFGENWGFGISYIYAFDNFPAFGK